MDKFAIPKRNLYYIIAGLAVQVIGYLLLLGGGAVSPDEFNYALFSFTRMYVSPVLILAGYVLVIVALMVRRPLFKGRNSDKRSI